MVPWGKTRLGKKRFYCKNCGVSRILRRKESSQNIFTLFRQYVLRGFTYQVISETSGYSVRYLEYKFHSYLRLDPPYLPKLDQSSCDETFLLIDGLWFKRWYVMMVYRQSKNLNILHISFAGREWGGKIAKDLILLKEKGYVFTGIISDGGKGVISAVNDVFPHIPHQVCLAHMTRRIISAVGRFPKDRHLQELKFFADWVWNIESKGALNWWKDKLIRWKNRNWIYLIEKRHDTLGNWWFVHKGARYALRTLLSLPSQSFAFLDHPTMPRTTNELEAQFGHIGKRWLSHRGLKIERWEQFMKWFVYFYNQEKMSCNKSKED